MTTVIKIKRLEIGQEVALANCRDTGSVVCRLYKNMYRVLYHGKKLDMPRNQLGVNVHGQWKFGAFDAA